MNTGFAHEKLRVYQQATGFVGWAAEILTRVPTYLAVYDQLDRASVSVPLNIAEANSRFSGADRCKFFDTARGSALECAACLDVLVAKDFDAVDRFLPGKQALQGIVCMLVGLIRSASPGRLHEEGLDYSSDGPQNPSAQKLFDHENLRVYQDSLKLITCLAALLQVIPKSVSLWNQLDRSSTSICLNIAEGNGKFSGPDRARFFRTSFGCSLRCSAGLDLLVVRKDLTDAQILSGKKLLQGIASMLMGLIKNESNQDLREPQTEYRSSITD